MLGSAVDASLGYILPPNGLQAGILAFLALGVIAVIAGAISNGGYAIDTTTRGLARTLLAGFGVGFAVGLPWAWKEDRTETKARQSKFHECFRQLLSRGSNCTNHPTEGGPCLSRLPDEGSLASTAPLLTIVLR